MVSRVRPRVDPATRIERRRPHGTTTDVVADIRRRFIEALRASRRTRIDRDRAGAHSLPEPDDIEMAYFAHDEF